MESRRVLILNLASLAFVAVVGSSSQDPQTSYGDIEFGFFPTVAPKTVEPIFKLDRLGGYNTNHFFRIDKGFVAQIADLENGLSAPMNKEQRVEAEKTTVGEFSDVKYVPWEDTEMESCEKERSVLKTRLEASFVEIERQRMKCFP